MSNRNYPRVSVHDMKFQDQMTPDTSWAGRGAKNIYICIPLPVLMGVNRTQRFLYTTEDYRGNFYEGYSNQEKKINWSSTNLKNVMTFLLAKPFHLRWHCTYLTRMETDTFGTFTCSAGPIFSSNEALRFR